jgi:hypothetical protein
MILFLVKDLTLQVPAGDADTVDVPHPGALFH